MTNNSTLKTKSIVTAALFAALTAIFSQLMIPIGPVPINLATLSVFISAGLLGTKYGTISQTIFILMGAVGIPVYAGFGAGFSKLLGPTGGYLIGYIVTAAITGTLINKLGSKFISCIISMIIGLLACYSMGTLWFVYVTGNSFIQSLTICVFPFIIGDALKILLASTIVIRLKNKLN